jgi:hypothetical protein
MAEKFPGSKYLQARMPANYIACASGVAYTPAGFQLLSGETHKNLEQLDGVMYGVYIREGQPGYTPPETNPSPSAKTYGTALVSIQKITDGTTKTVAMGEAWFDVSRASAAGADGYPNPEAVRGSRKDHWIIGGDNIQGLGSTGVSDPTEAMGSTGVPPNLHRDPSAFNGCDGGAHGAPPPPKAAAASSAAMHIVGPIDCEGLQLSFSSDHPGIVQLGMCDGSLNVIDEDIDLDVYEKMGTRTEKFVQISPY